MNLADDIGVAFLLRLLDAQAGRGVADGGGVIAAVGEQSERAECVMDPAGATLELAVVQHVIRAEADDNRRAVLIRSKDAAEAAIILARPAEMPANDVVAVTCEQIAQADPCVEGIDNRCTGADAVGVLVDSGSDVGVFRRSAADQIGVERDDTLGETFGDLVQVVPVVAALDELARHRLALEVQRAGQPHDSLEVAAGGVAAQDRDQIVSEARPEREVG